MNRLGFEPSRFSHPLGSSAGRRAEQQLHALGYQDPQNGVDDGRLADARPACDDQDLRLQGQSDGGNLAFGERQADPPLDPRQSLLRIDVGPRQWSIQQATESFRNDLLRAV